jgi:hypothetical protein
MFRRKRSHKPHTPRRQMAPTVRLSLERLEAREVPSTLQPLTEPESVAIYPPESPTLGPQGNQWAAFSADGRYLAFEHDQGIFVHDRLTGATNRVDVAVDGGSPNGISESAAISANGRFVAFWSWASNLVRNDTNGLPDVFVRDTQTGTTILASVTADGNQLRINDPGNLSISADGQFVAFDGIQKITAVPPPGVTPPPGGPLLPVTIYPGVIAQLGEVYLFNQSTGAASLIGSGYNSLISANGLFVFYANQPNDVVTDWSLYDRESDSTRVITPSWNDLIPDFVWKLTRVLWISDDGRQVGFQRYYNTNFSGPHLWIGLYGSYVTYDVQTGELSSLPHVSGTDYSVSADGRYVAFLTVGAFSPWPFPSTLGNELYILDRQTGSVARVSEGLDGNPEAAVISPDGQSVVFWKSSVDIPNPPGPPFIYEEQIFLYVGDGTPQIDTAAPQPTFGPMLAFALPHSGGTANLIAWDLTGDGTADFVILTRRVHQRLNVTAFDMTTHKPLLHFGFTRPKQMPQFFSAMAHLNRDKLLGLLSAATPRPIEPFGLFSTALFLASA